MTHLLCVTSSSIDEATSGMICFTLQPLFILNILFVLSLTVPVFLLCTDSLCNLDIPVIDVDLDGIFDFPHISPFRNSVALLESTNNRAESEEDCESTAL